MPEHVVYRDFVSETVVLNLETAQYHGLNPTAARMLARITESSSVRQAAEQIAAEYGRDAANVEIDVLGLARDLLSRGLLVRIDE